MTQTMDLYTDFLIANTGLASVSKAGLALGISKDKISRFLGGVTVFTKNRAPINVAYQTVQTFEKKGLVSGHIKFNNQDLWGLVKKDVRACEEAQGLVVGLGGVGGLGATLIIDDTIIEKEFTDENDIVCWHHDHCSGRSVKGINLLNGGLYYPGQDQYIPIFAELITKTIKYTDPKDNKEKRKSEVNKNELFRNNFNCIMKNHIKLEITLFDIWYGSVENLNFINGHRQKYICPLKSNRKLALSKNEKKSGKWYKLEEITSQLDTQKTLEIWLEGSTHSNYLTKQVFENQDGTIVTMYLITNDQNLTKDQIHNNYKRRWKVEEFHKSLKSNLGIESSPTKHQVSQNNHIFCSVIAYFKLENLIKTPTARFKNHFQLKASLLVKALQTTYQELQLLKMGCER